MMLAAEVVNTSDGQLWWLGVIFGALLGIVITTLVVAHHFSRREQAVYETGHMDGWDAAMRAGREGRL